MFGHSRWCRSRAPLFGAGGSVGPRVAHTRRHAAVRERSTVPPVAAAECTALRQCCPGADIRKRRHGRVEQRVGLWSGAGTFEHQPRDDVVPRSRGQLGAGACVTDGARRHRLAGCRRSADRVHSRDQGRLPPGQGGLALRISGIARFAGPGPMGVVRSGWMITLHSRTPRLARPHAPRAVRAKTANEPRLLESVA